MTPQGITVHNTYNDAGATAEISFMLSNNNKVSYHYAVDDKQAVQGVPLTRYAFHAGDGSGFGNRSTIGIEICYSKSGGARFTAAEKNAVILIAQLMIQYGWTMAQVGVKQINTHKSRSGKNCPHRTLPHLAKFWKQVEAEYNKLKSAGRWVGLGSRWWYRRADGSYPRAGWSKIDGRWYLFDANGWMLTGWQKVKDKWYYLGGASDGAMKSGWQKISEKWYYLGGADDGAMKTGWLDDKGKRYYLASSGAMVTDTQTIDGKAYTFDGSGALVN
jgi:hypothetical protein